MKTRILLPVLLLSAVFVSPASANWFSNPSLGIDLNIGSAPSPTPDQVRADRQPMLVRDAEGNVIAMIDPATGKMIAIAEPTAAAQKSNNAAKVTPACNSRPIISSMRLSVCSFMAPFHRYILTLIPCRSSPPPAPQSRR